MLKEGKVYDSFLGSLGQPLYFSSFVGHRGRFSRHDDHGIKRTRGKFVGLSRQKVLTHFDFVH